jgi:ABC-2 type transport system permease protein
MKGYLNVELRRTLRDPFYTILAVVVPIGFYLLFAGLFGSSPHAPGTLSGNVGIMVAMAVYGGIWACLVATGPRIAVERSSGWMRNLRLLPISTWSVLLGRALVAIFFALPTMLLVYATAALTHHVVLSPGQWLAMIALTWIGVWPFALLGLALGFLTNENSAFGVTYGIYMAISALGGLWVPPTILPANMLAFGKLLPTYQAANLGWRIALGDAPAIESAAVLIGWSIVLLIVVMLFSSRAMKTR